MPAFLPIVSKFDDKGVKKASSSLKRFGGAVGKIAAAATAAVAGIAVAGVREFVKFDEALNKSTAIMGDVSDAMRKDMSDAAREVAKNTTFAADEAAEAFFFLASAGLDAEQQIAAMPQVAAFAQAGMFDMATATDLATDAQSALGLASDDAEENLANLTRVTDVFVKANTLANTSVEQLASALTTKAGNALKTVNKDVEEGAAVLAVFADQGIKGERAGTLLTNTLFGLTENAEKNSDAFNRLGIEVFGAEGEVRNMAEIADDVTKAFDGMSEEQKLAEITALGFTKQTREGVLALAGQGAQLAEYEAAMRDAGGTTQEVAEKQLATPGAQFDLLKSSIQDVLLEFEPLAIFLGNVADAMRPIVDSVGPRLREFFERLQPTFENASETFSNFTERFAQGDTTIKEGLSNIFDSITGFFTGDGLTNALEGLMEFRQTLIFNLIEIIPDIAQGIAQAVPEIVRAIAGAIPQMLENALEIFNQLVAAFNIVLPQVVTALVEAIPEIVNALVFQLPLIIQGALDLFLGIVQGILKALPVIVKALIGAIPTILDALITALPALIEAAFELFQGIVTGLIDNIPLIVDALIEMTPDLVEGLLESLPKLVDAAFQIITAIANEIIIEGPKKIGEAITGLGNAMADKFKNFFGISSPSKLFEEYGSNLVEGLSEGLQDGKRELEGASVNMASTVRVSAEDTLSATSARLSAPSQSAAQGNAINVTVNAGAGADGQAIGKEIVNQIRKYERINGATWRGA